MAKKWPEMVVQRSFIKGHSFPYRLYLVENSKTDATIAAKMVIDSVCPCLGSIFKRAKIRGDNLTLFPPGRDTFYRPDSISRD